MDVARLWTRQSFRRARPCRRARADFWKRCGELYCTTEVTIQKIAVARKRPRTRRSSGGQSGPVGSHRFRQAGSLARFPSEWSHSLDKKSRKFKKPERVPFARTIPCERYALWRFPSEWSRSLDKKSRKFKKLERVLFARTMPCERSALWATLLSRLPHLDKFDP
jgi:hypothetical protein